METTNASYDERVAELDDDVFWRAAAEMNSALRVGDGLRMWFQPGDATRYLLTIDRRRTVVLSNGEPRDTRWVPISDVRVTFGTESDVTTLAMGHADRLSVSHAWTSAVWRRLWRELAAQFPREAWSDA